MPSKEAIPPNNIETIRRQKKWSMAKLGDKVGVDASTINKIEKSKIRPGPERMLSIAEALGVTLDDLFSIDYVPPASGTTSFSSSEGPQIPVMGSAAGSLLSGTMQITEGPVDWIDRPRALENAKGIYGLYIVGTSMEPLYRHGQLVVVSEYKPVRLGDAVIVQEQHGENSPILASIGILESRSSDKIILKKFNPAGQVDIGMKYVVKVHKVVEYGELLGLA